MINIIPECNYTTSIAVCRYNTPHIDYIIEDRLKPIEAAKTKRLEQDSKYIIQRENGFLLEEAEHLTIFGKISNPVKILSGDRSQTITNLFLDRVYSTNTQQSEINFTENIHSLFSNDITKEVILYLAFQISYGKNYPVVRNKNQDYETLHTSLTFKSNPLKILDSSFYKNGCSYDDNIYGMYNSGFNTLCFKENNDALIIHEMTHATMRYIFNNDALPYPKTSSYNKIEKDYHNAIQEAWDKIQASSSKVMNKDEKLLSNLMKMHINSPKYTRDSETIANFIMLYPIIPEDIIDKYCESMKKFWQQNITPLIMSLAEKHGKECAGEEKLQFDYCISSL